MNQNQKYLIHYTRYLSTAESMNGSSVKHGGESVVVWGSLT